MRNATEFEIGSVTVRETDNGWKVILPPRVTGYYTNQSIVCEHRDTAVSIAHTYNNE